MEIMTLKGEKFYPIRTFNGEEYPEYEISNLGRVYQLPGENPETGRATGNKIKKAVDFSGVYSVRLKMNDGKTRTRQIERLMWETFNGKVPSGRKVTQIDPNATYPFAIDNLKLEEKHALGREVLLFDTIDDKTISFKTIVDLTNMLGVDKSLVYRAINNGSLIKRRYKLITGDIKNK